MYFRIMNQLDLSCMEQAIHEAIGNPEVSEEIFQRISSRIEVLDAAYGEGRKALDMGGFVFLMTDPQISGRIKDELLECYSLLEEDCEYKEEIRRETDGKKWFEELYLRGSEDAIVIIYVENKK